MQDGDFSQFGLAWKVAGTQSGTVGQSGIVVEAVNGLDRENVAYQLRPGARGDLTLTYQLPLQLAAAQTYAFEVDLQVTWSTPSQAPVAEVALTGPAGRVVLRNGSLSNGRSEWSWRGVVPRDGAYTLSLLVRDPVKLAPNWTCWLDNFSLRPANAKIPFVRFVGIRKKATANTLQISGTPSRFALLLLSTRGRSSPLPLGTCDGQLMLAPPYFIVFSTVRIPASGMVSTPLTIPAVVGGQALYWQALDWTSPNLAPCGLSCPKRYGFF